MKSVDYPDGFVEDIAKFFESEKSRPPGLDLYEDVFKTNLFFPLQRKAELRRMMQIARKFNPKTVMEIGSCGGGGFYHLVKGLQAECAIACEIRGCPYSDLFEAAFEDVCFQWMEESSYAPEQVATVRQFLAEEPVNKKIDVLFIDGCKLSFLKDFDAYLPLMNPEGVVFLHDITDPPSSNCIQRDYLTIKNRGYLTEDIIDRSDYENLVEPTCPYEDWLSIWKGQSCGVGVVYLGSKK